MPDLVFPQKQICFFFQQILQLIKYVIKKLKHQADYVKEDSNIPCDRKCEILLCRRPKNNDMKIGIHQLLFDKITIKTQFSFNFE